MRPVSSNFCSRLLLRLSLVALSLLALVLVPQLRVASAKQPAASADPAADPDADPDADDGSDVDDEDTETGERVVEAPETNAAPEGGEDLETLRAEYFKLRDRLFQSKARASAVAGALYSTRLSVQLDYGSARYYTVTRATIRLDGANIFDDTSGAISADDANRFEGYIAPGRHQLSIRIEATGKDDDRFTTIIDNSFVVQASKGKDLDVVVRAQDGGNIAYGWSKKERGSYKLHMNVEVKTLKRSTKKQNSAKRASQLRQHDPESKSRG